MRRYFVGLFLVVFACVDGIHAAFTPRNSADLNHAVVTCLKETPADGACPIFAALNSNGGMGEWQTGKVTDLSFLFLLDTVFNGDISNWETKSVTSMANMFDGASSFNGDLSKWDTRSTKNMQFMFSVATKFNADLSKWQVGSVGNLHEMFGKAPLFNADLSKWNVGAATDMTGSKYTNNCLELEL